jgi:hypothetical protein
VTERAREAAPARPPPTRQLEVGHPDSALERAADRAAERVTGRAAAAPRAGAPWPDGRAVPALVHEVLRSPGSALDPAQRSVFEPALGAGLSGVRLHDDAAAAASARAVGAAAYTVGSHVVFGAGRHAPGIPEGRALIAHELAHVLQRRDGLLQRVPEPAAVEEVPAAQSGPLASAEGWVTRLREEFDGYGDDHVPQRYAAGRAWRIFELVSLPDLRRQAQAGTGLTQASVDQAVAFAREQGATEHLAGMRIDIRENYTLFPETLARWYDEEAASLRAILAFDPDPPDDSWKVELAKAGKREQFLFLSETYEGERIEAGLLEDVAADVLGGVFPEVTFEEHKRLLAEEARRLAREAGQAEYDAYVGLAQDPQGTRAAAESEEAARALAKQAPTAGQELVAVELFAVQRRLERGSEVMAASVLDAWAKAQTAILALNPIIRAGSMAPEQQAEAADAAEAFLTAFRAEVEQYDVEQKIELTLEPSMVVTTNPYVSPEVAYFVPRLREARTPADWAWPVAVFGRVVESLDRYIADRLTARGRAPEAAELVGAGALTQELSALLDKAPEAKKVQAVFFPDAEELRNAGPPGAPDFSVTGFPLSWYVHRKDEVWYLTDLSNPDQPKVVSDAGGTADAPALALFEQLNTALRFPVGHLYWQLDGTPGDLATTAEWGATEWLTLFSVLAGAAALAVAAAASFGATVPASVILLTGVGAAVLSAGAAVADVAERSQAGVLTTKDVVVDTLALAGAFAGVGSMALGKVAVSDAVKTAAGLTRLQAVAEQAFVPVVLAGVGTDLASFAVLLGDAPAQLAAIDKMTNDRDRNLARARLVGLMLLSGAMLLLAAGGVPRDAPRLYVDLAPDGTQVVRPFLTDPDLATAAAGLQRPEAVTAVVGRADLSQALRDRLRAGISEALTVGPVQKGKLEELLERLGAAVTPAEVEEVLGELTSRSRIGAHLGPDVAAAASPSTALRLNGLPNESLGLLKGASQRQLDQVAGYMSEDPALTVRLFKEFGLEMAEHVRLNPTTSVRDVEKVLRQAKTKTPGFVESVDPVNDPPGLELTSKEYVIQAGRKKPKDTADWPDGVRYIDTSIAGPGDSMGLFQRSYDPVTGVVEMKAAYLRIGGVTTAVPSKITHPGQHMAGEATPTVHYMNIYQLKRLGVPVAGAGAGAPRKTIMNSIENAETLAHLHWLRREHPNMTDGERIAQTASVRYATGSWRQMGYEAVGGFEITHGSPRRIGEVLEDQGDAALMKKNDEMLAPYGVTRDTVVEMDFDIIFSVAPRQ